MTVDHHEIRFFRNKTTGLAKAACSCGWAAFGDLTRVQTIAATHPEDWQAIEVASAEPATVSA